MQSLVPDRAVDQANWGRNGVLERNFALISGTGSGPLWLPCPHYEELLGFSFP